MRYSTGFPRGIGTFISKFRNEQIFIFALLRRYLTIFFHVNKGFRGSCLVGELFKIVDLFGLSAMFRLNSQTDLGT